jgi:hypothetical protein
MAGSKAAALHALTKGKTHAEDLFALIFPLKDNVLPDEKYIIG